MEGVVYDMNFLSSSTKYQKIKKKKKNYTFEHTKIVQIRSHDLTLVPQSL